MSLSAYKTVRDDHEDRQDGRLLALETTGASDEARLLVLEGRTQHMEEQPDHTRHGRRLQATDRITVDSISDLAHATLEAVSANTHDASLRLIRGTTGSETVLSHEAGGNTTLSVAGNTVLSVSQVSGGTTVGSGVGVELSGNAVVKPDASIATLTLVGPTNTDDAAINMTHGTSNSGWRLEADATASEFRITRDNAGSHDIAVRLDGVGNATLKGLDNRIEGEENDNSVLALTERVTGNANNFGVGLRYNGTTDRGQLVAYDGVSTNLQAPDATVVEWQRGGNLLSLMNAPADYAGTTTVGNGTVQTSSTTYCVLDIQGTATQGVRLPNLDTTNANIMCVGGLDGTVAFDTGRDRLVYKGSGTAARVVADSGTSQVASVAVDTVVATEDGLIDASKARTTASFTELTGTGDQAGKNYPSVTLSGVQAGDQIELSGFLGIDVGSYNDSPDQVRISLWQTAIGGGGTLINPSDVVMGAGGDNNTEVQSCYYPSRRFTVASAGTYYACWALKAYNSNARAIGIAGVRATVQAVVHRQVTLPTV
jgi:hypothetical protein